jgi:hypothetical protein
MGLLRMRWIWSKDYLGNGFWTTPQKDRAFCMNGFGTREIACYVERFSFDAGVGAVAVCFASCWWVWLLCFGPGSAVAVFSCFFTVLAVVFSCSVFVFLACDWLCCLVFCFVWFVSCGLIALLVLFVFLNNICLPFQKKNVKKIMVLLFELV